MLNLEEILSRNSYLLSIELRVVWGVSLGYLLALICFLFYHITKSISIARAGKALLWLSAIVHVGAILLRAFESGHLPLQGVYESLSFFGCAMVFVNIYALRDYKEVILPWTLVSALAGASCLYVLLQWSPAIMPLKPLLQSYWYVVHVPIAVFTYAVLTVSVCIETSFLLAKRALRKRSITDGLTMESIEAFHSKTYNLVTFAFPLFTFVIFTGAVWSYEGLGRYWNWGEKETWSLITWTVFALYLHSRSIPRFKGRIASAFNIIGAFCIMTTFSGPVWISRLLSIPGRKFFSL
jgi:cytochrome c-type biogenesis protein CcsB